MRRFLLSAALILSTPSALAQFGGLGDPGWGWKRKVCHYCLEGVEVNVHGGPGQGDAQRLVNDAGNPFSLSLDPEAFGFGLRVGIGPLFFVDADRQTIDLAGDGGDASVSREYTVNRIGGGIFLINRPGSAAFYVRAGHLDASLDAALSIQPLPEAQRTSTSGNGAQRGFELDAPSGFGVGGGGIFHKGKTSIELQGMAYGDASEARAVLSRAFNQRLSIGLYAHWLSLDKLEARTVEVGATQSEARTFRWVLAEDETLVTYGLNVQIRF